MSRTLRRLIPSPAMLVALVALVVSLGSSGYASQIVPTLTGDNIINNSVTGKDIRDLTRKDIRKRSLRGRKFELNSVGDRAIKESRLETVPSASGLELWAVVRDNGNLARGEGLAAGDVGRYGAPSPEPGEYQVIFNSEVDMHKCAYQATLGTPEAEIPVGDSQITVSPLPSNPNKGLLVRTADSANMDADRAFQLAVIC